MASSPPAKKSRQEEEDETEDPAVTLFREYLRIPTISRGENYQKHYGRHSVSSLEQHSLPPTRVLRTILRHKVVVPRCAVGCQHSRLSSLAIWHSNIHIMSVLAAHNNCKRLAAMRLAVMASNRQIGRLSEEAAIIVHWLTTSSQPSP